MQLSFLYYGYFWRIENETRLGYYINNSVKILFIGRPFDMCLNGTLNMNRLDRKLDRAFQRPAPGCISMRFRTALYFFLMLISKRLTKHLSWIIFSVEWQRRKALYKYISRCRLGKPTVSHIDRSVFYTWALLNGKYILTYREVYGKPFILPPTITPLVYVNDGKTCDVVLSSFHVQGTADGSRYYRIMNILNRVSMFPPDHPNCRCAIVHHDVKK